MIEPTREDDTLIHQALEILQTEGFAGLGQAVELLMNTAMRIERQEYLRAAPYERSPERQSYSNGYKPKTVQSRVGKLSLSVPQTRDGFYPTSLEKGQRSERALKTALAEMYLQGVSTRKVAKITEQLCGFAVTSDQVSSATQELDELLETWRERPLEAYKYLYLDARYEKVRDQHTVIDAAVLVAIGVRPDGCREVVGVSVMLSEAEVHWRLFLESLVKRGLHGVELIVSDDHAGLKAARRSVLPSIPWQRCQFHLQQNAQAYVKRLSDRAEVGESIRAIFNAPNLDEARRLLQLAVAAYEKTNPRLAQWMEANLPEGFTAFAFGSKQLQKKLRTTNPLERLNREIKRRTKVVSIFPNASSCLRLVTAILMETSEEWVTGKRFVKFEEVMDAANCS